MSELQEVRDRLITLETQSEERWGSHDKQSKLIWGIIDDKLDILLGHKDGQEVRKDACMEEAKDHTDKAIKGVNSKIAWVLGIPATLCTLVMVVVNWKKMFPIIVVTLLLSGCSIHTHFYDSNDRQIGHVEQSQAGAAIIDNGKLKMQVDTRKPNLWDRFITPIVKGISDSARENVTLN